MLCNANEARRANRHSTTVGQTQRGYHTYPKVERRAAGAMSLTTEHFDHSLPLKEENFTYSGMSQMEEKNE